MCKDTLIDVNYHSVILDEGQVEFVLFTKSLPDQHWWKGPGSRLSTSMASPCGCRLLGSGQRSVIASQLRLLNSTGSPTDMHIHARPLKLGRTSPVPVSRKHLITYYLVRCGTCPESRWQRNFGRSRGTYRVLTAPDEGWRGPTKVGRKLDNRFCTLYTEN